MYVTLMKSDTVESSGRTVTTQKKTQDLVGRGNNQRTSRPGRTWKKPKDLSVCESEEGGCGEGGGVYVTLMESDTVESGGRAEEDTRPGRTWNERGLWPPGGRHA